MKIGILTFHSQLNYGGVLQCWALQRALESMGHQVVVLDRLMEVQIRSLRAIFGQWTLRRWIGFIARLALRRPSALRVIRHVRTVRFAQRHLHITDYSFRDWSDAPENLGVDMIVVGSDQVWNPLWNTVGIYLLEGAPSVPAIGYAISLGVSKLLLEAEPHFRAAAGRFNAVSARESSAAEILRPYFGEVAHVVDPVLLIGREVNGRQVRRSGRRHLVGYFIKTKLDECLPRLQDIAEQNNLVIHLLVDGRQNQPKSGSGTLRVRWHLSAGPNEFIGLIANSDGVFTDSFHATMYAYKYGRQVSVLRPTEAERVAMFDRMRECLAETQIENTVEDTVLSLLHGECRWTKEFEGRVADSLRWLQTAMERRKE